MMNNQDDRVEEQRTQFDANRPEVSVAVRKAFVEPEISDPVDALKATTFFFQTSEIDSI
jgi:hypothetical protein